MHSPGSFVVHPTNSDILYVTVQNYLLKSVDGGSSWIDLDLGNTVPYYKVIIDPEEPQNIIVNKGNVILISKDEGKSWCSINYNLDSLNVRMPQYNTHIRKVFCSTVEGFGTAYFLNYDDIELSLDFEPDLINQFRLNQNYPNPFNPNTTIPYQLSEPSFVRLDIININGQLIETLVNRQIHTGYHTANWNASNVSTGVYFYHIKVTDGSGSLKFTDTKKCIIVK